MQITGVVSNHQIAISQQTSQKDKSNNGQFFTPEAIAIFMASLFENIAQEVQLLDPGCGLGILSAAFIEEAAKRGNTKNIAITGYDTDVRVLPYMDSFYQEIKKLYPEIAFDTAFHNNDFILESTEMLEGLFATEEQYTHVIMNPPYKKIPSKSQHKKQLKSVGMEAVNLYAAFIMLALKQLKPDGELVAIIPRSFCNGAYYKPFRKYLLSQASIKRIHLFGSRSSAFGKEQVLQENVIIHLQKQTQQKEVVVSFSEDAAFKSAPNFRTIPFKSIVHPKDPEQYIYITTNDQDQKIINKINRFWSKMSDLGIEVSTGPVVDFRLKEDLQKEITEGSVPLLYPVHLSKGIVWPKASKKPNAIKVSPQSRKWLWANEGYFVLVRRFSSKEEKKRITATVYNGQLPGNLVGFDNKLNVFHTSKKGLAKALARGLYIYLNCTLLDSFFRLFSGHTQVNATDLRNIPYPSLEVLIDLGTKGGKDVLTQNEIDLLIEDCLAK